MYFWPETQRLEHIVLKSHEQKIGRQSVMKSWGKKGLIEAEKEQNSCHFDNSCYFICEHVQLLI